MALVMAEDGPVALAQVDRDVEEDGQSGEKRVHHHIPLRTKLRGHQHGVGRAEGEVHEEVQCAGERGEAVAPPFVGHSLQDHAQHRAAAAHGEKTRYLHVALVAVVVLDAKGRHESRRDEQHEEGRQRVEKGPEQRRKHVPLKGVHFLKTCDRYRYNSFLVHGGCRSTHPFVFLDLVVEVHGEHVNQ